MKTERLFPSSFPLSAAKTRDFPDGAALINDFHVTEDEGELGDARNRLEFQSGGREEGGRRRRDHLAQHIWLNKRPSATHVMAWA